MPRFRSTGISRKLTIVAVGGVLCVAAVGTATVAGSWLVVTGPTASVVRAADGLNSLQALNSQKLQSDVTKQALIMETERRTAAAQVESVEAAAAARRAAASAAAAREKAARQAAAQQAATRQASQLTAQPSAGSPQQIAQQMLGQYGWTGQFSCLDSLWTLESGWNIYAENPTTGAYGIPQALPGVKMASAGPDWQSDPTTQIRWGLNYIQASYGSPCAAWSHEEATGWY